MLNNLLSLSFWFDLQPPVLSPTFERGFFILFAGMIIIGSIARIVARKKDVDRFVARGYKRIAQMIVVMGFVGLIWYFFSYELVYFLGARFWFLVWAIGLCYWVFRLYQYFKHELPALQETVKNREEGNKYLPRKKSR